MYKVWVIADSSGKWASNQMLYETVEEAERAAKDLAARWILVRDWIIKKEGENPNVIL